MMIGPRMSYLVAMKLFPRWIGRLLPHNAWSISTSKGLPCHQKCKKRTVDNKDENHALLQILKNSHQSEQTVVNLMG